MLSKLTFIFDSHINTKEGTRLKFMSKGETCKNNLDFIFSKYNFYTVFESVATL